MVNVASMLDRAKLIHKLPSDYKLALVMGVEHGSLRNYRTGKTLPDARVISALCALTGDDAALLAAEIEAERAKTDEARALWSQVVQRMRSTLHIAVFSVVAALVLGAGFPTDAAAANGGFFKATSYTSWNIRQALARLAHRWRAVHRWCYSARLFSEPCHV